MRWSRRQRRLAAFTVLAVLAALPTVAPSASADPIADKRAQADRIAQEMHDFDAQLEETVQLYNKATGDLAQIRAKIKENKARLALARANLTAARAQLAEIVVGSYKGADASDLTAYVLGSGSFSELVDRIEYVSRASRMEADVVAQIRASEKEIANRQNQLKEVEGKAQALVADVGDKKRAIEAGLAQRRQMLASVRSDIRQLIAQRERARERAAAAAAAAAQQPPAPSSDEGSGGGDGSGGGGGFTPPPGNSTGQQAVQIAMRYLGVPYVWGGASPSGFDCSGLTMYAYAQLGISLPHFTGSQWTAGPHVSRDQLAPGDLVFFTPSLGHMGMYIGNGSFIHAPHTGDVVKISSLSDPWYSSEYQGAVRVTG